MPKIDKIPKRGYLKSSSWIRSYVISPRRTRRSRRQERI